MNKPLSIPEQVKQGLIHWSCFDCAKQHSIQDPYDGTFTVHQDTCEICKETKMVSSAKKTIRLSQIYIGEQNGIQIRYMQKSKQL